jgi:hypothetical protein
VGRDEFGTATGQLVFARQHHGEPTRFRFLSIHRPSSDEPSAMFLPGQFTLKKL